MNAAAIEITNLSKAYRARRALDGVSIEIAPGEMVALIGASGSGKSTLLRHIAGLAPAEGKAGGHITVNQRRVQIDGRAARGIRRIRAEIGFVFQQFNLVPRSSVLVNVLAGRLARIPFWRSLPKIFTAQERAAAISALGRVGIADCAWQRASTLSGGQQQRAAIARALVQDARIILADEPIASLDPESSRRVMEILRDINRDDGRTVVVSLHQVDYALTFCSRLIALKDGRVRFDGPSAEVTPGLLRQIYGTDSDLDFDRIPQLAPGVAPATRPAPELVRGIA